jgi:hypothetical protein
MKKFMVADMVKDIRSDKIKTYMDNYNLSEIDLKEVNDRSKEYYDDGILEIDLPELEYPFQIVYLMKPENYDLNSDEAFYLVDNWDNEAEWKDVMLTAEALEMGIEDVSDDDVEEYLSTGGQDEIVTSMGNVFFKWDNIAKAYVLYMFLDMGQDSKCNGIQVYNNITRDMILQMKSSSFGEYYNENLRKNTSYEGCGCEDNCCEDADLDNAPQEFKSYL